MHKTNGQLILIPSFLSPTNEADYISSLNLSYIQGIRYFIVEQVRTARRFLRKVGFDVPFDEVVFYELNKHTDPSLLATYLNPAVSGNDIGLISEAGMPCIADPGAGIVKLAHERSIRVVPLAGASSILMALIASGLNGQHFVFHGYLPIDTKERENKLREIEKQSALLQQTQIFMETPYRNNQLIRSVIKICHPSTLLTVAVDISDPKNEFIRTKSIGDWADSVPELHKRPAVFLLYKNN
jgi:16S rRNA (cytidine1402-2'-O)-methyltransferase